MYFLAMMNEPAERSAQAAPLNVLYVFKHWAATLFVSPFLLSLYGALSSGAGWVEIATFFPLFLSFGFMFSLPALLGSYLLFLFAKRKPWPVLYRKLLLIAFAVLNIAITFWIIGGSFAPVLGLAYAAGAILFGFVFRLGSRWTADPANG